MNDEARGGTGERLVIVTKPTISELIHTSAALSRSGFIGTAIGGFSATFAIIGVFLGIPWFALLPSALIAAVLLSGYYTAPFIWFVANRRRDLVLAPTTITLDSEGVGYATPTVTGQHAWSVYRRARDVGNAILLDAAPGIGALIPKSAIDDEAALMRVLTAHGLIRPPTAFQRAKPIIWFAIGALAAIVQLVVQGAVDSG